MNNTKAVNERFAKFLSEFEGFEELLQVLLNCKSLSDLSEQISLTEKAKLNVALAYLANSLYYIYMKTNGMSFECHKINDEMELIKKYMLKVHEAVFIQEKQRKNPLVVDKAATERMVRAHLGDFADQNPAQTTIGTKDNSKLNQAEDLFELEEPELTKPSKNQPPKNSKKLLRGNLLPSEDLINWKDKINRMLK